MNITGTIYSYNSRQLKWILLINKLIGRNDIRMGRLMFSYKEIVRKSTFPFA